MKLIYEGNNQVKKTKANLVVHEYELFKMKSEKSISEILLDYQKSLMGSKLLERGTQVQS